MEKQKEALIRIVESLKHKYDETSAFQDGLTEDMQTLSEAYETSEGCLNAEFDKLHETLKTQKECMMKDIANELMEKKVKLKAQLQGCENARKDANELISLAQKASEIEDSTEFNQAALSIKARITMSSIFRLSIVPCVTDLQCHMIADFSREESLLQKVSFLPVPETPIITEENCSVANNCVTCEWSMKKNETGDDAESSLPSPTGSYLFQYRQVFTTDQAILDFPWKTIENVKKMKYVIQDLNFAHPYIQVRVQAYNKGVFGEYSKILTLPTPAYNFSLDSEAVHANLKVVGAHKVEWDPSATKPVEPRVRSAGSSRSVSSSPSKTFSPKKLKHKARFIGESHTVLGDTIMTENESYFEVTPHKDCKTFAVGITANSLARYDQLGKTPTSWGLFVTKWIQNSFAAKHNNKLKNLDASVVPSRIGVYYNKDQNCLAFYDADTHDCVHLFKQIKCSSPLLPGFSVWCGSMEIHTGLQVPAWVDTELVTSLKGKPPSAASSETNEVSTVDTISE